jgi:methylase of polypeptide subunit release factors
MLHIVLFLTYSKHNPAKDLKPPKLVEFVSSKLTMHRNIFIPTLFTEMLVVDVVINDCQQQDGQPVADSYLERVVP